MTRLIAEVDPYEFLANEETLAGCGVEKNGEFDSKLFQTVKPTTHAVRLVNNPTRISVVSPDGVHLGIKLKTIKGAE